MRFAIGPWKELLFGQRGLEKKRGQKSAASRGRKSRLEPLEPRHLLSTVTTILMPDADAQLRDGSGGAKNFGIHPSLVVRNDNGLDQQAILRFDLSGIHGNVTWARLELPRAIYAPDSSGSVPRLELEWLDNDHWSETLVTMDQVDAWEAPHFIQGFRNEYLLITDVIQETMETGNHVITFRIRDQYANEPGFVAYRAHESESTASPRLRIQSEPTDNSLGFTTAGMHRYWPGGSHGSGGGDEDDAAGTATASGTQLQLTGDAWKAAAFNYEVTTRTVLEFEFQSTSEGVAHAIGLDTDLSYNANADHLFLLAGARSDPSKTWTHTEYADDGIGDGWRTYRIPVGEFLGSNNLTGGYVTFVNDQLIQDPQATSTFRNVRFREAGRVTNYYLDPLHGDFDGDGQTETLRLDLTGRWVQGADGATNWLGERPLWDLGGGTTRAEHYGVVGDFNGDGYGDVAARTRSSKTWQVAVAIEEEFRLADSVWGAWGLAESWEPHYVGDFNGDARDDLLRINALTGGLEVSLSTGTSFSTSVWEAWDLGVDWQDIRIADFTGDGRDDLAAKHAVTGDWSLAVSDGTRFLTSSVDAPAGWNDTLLGDFDGDERAELLVWDGSRWRVIEYENSQLVRQQYDVGDALNGLGREFYMHVGDVNQDGRDDLLRYDFNGRRWLVGLSEQSGSVIQLDEQVWGNWFDDWAWGSTPEGTATSGIQFVDFRGPLEAITDEFAAVYNNVRLELYEGLMKGAEATEQTGRGNPWDQAALLVDRLDAAGFDADLVTGKITAPASEVERWVGATNVGGAVNIVRSAFDEGATYSSGRITFNHAWVRVTAPTATGLAAIDLDPSWKFRDFQEGVWGAHGESILVPFDNPLDHAYLSPVKNDDGQDVVRKELAFEFYEDAVMDYLAEHAPGMSIADVPYDGPILERVFKTIPSGLGEGVEISGSVARFENAAAIYASASASTNYTHRAQISIHRISGGDSIRDEHRIYSAPFVVPKHSLDPITVTGPVNYDLGGGGLSLIYTPTLQIGDIRHDDATVYLNNQPGRDRDDSMIVGAQVQFYDVGTGFYTTNLNESMRITIEHFNPGDNAPSSARDYARDPIEEIYGSLGYVTGGTGKIFAIGLDARQYSQEHLVGLRKNILGEPAHDRVEPLLVYAGAKYWHDFREQNEAITRLMHRASVQPAVGSGVLTADSSVNEFDFLQFGIVARDAFVDLKNWQHKDVDLGGAGSNNSDVFDVILHSASGLEHAVIEEVASTESVSTIRGFQLALLGDLEGESQRINGYQRGSRGTYRHLGYYDAAGFHPSAQTVNVATIRNELADHPTSVVDQIVGRLNFVGNFVWVPTKTTSVGNWLGSVFVSHYRDSEGSHINYAISRDNTTANGAFAGYYDPVEIETEAGSTPFFSWAGDPVNLANGNMFRDDLDIAFANAGVPLTFARHYDTQPNAFARLGVGWTHSFADSLSFPNDGDVIWKTSSGIAYRFKPGAANAYSVPTSLDGDFHYDEATTLYTYRDRDGTVTQFDTFLEGGAKRGRLFKKLDRNGNGIIVAYDNSATNRIKEVRDVHNHQRRLVFEHRDKMDARYVGTPLGGMIGRITQYSTPLSPGDPSPPAYSWLYGYDDIAGKIYLTVVSAPGVLPGAQYNQTVFAYYQNGPSQGLMQQANEPDGSWHHYLYYPNGRAFEVTDSEGFSHSFSYDMFRNVTTFVDERGRAHHYRYNDNGLQLEHTYPDRSREAYTWGDGQQEYKMTSETDRAGNTESYAYNDYYYPYPALVESEAADGLITRYYYARPSENNNILNVDHIVVDAVTSDNPDGKAIRTDFAYDAKGNLLHTTDDFGYSTTRFYYPDTHTAPHLRGLLWSETTAGGTEGGIHGSWQVLGDQAYTIRRGRLTVRLDLADDGGLTDRLATADAIRIDRVDGTMPSTAIIDNAATSVTAGQHGFRYTGAVGYEPNGNLDRAYNGSFSSLSTGSESAFWTFTGLPSGEYQVSAMWPGWDGHEAENARFRILGDYGGLLDDLSIDQRIDSVGFTSLTGGPREAEFTTTYAYDDAGNVTTVTTGLPATTRRTFNILGQVIREVDPTGVQTEFFYNPLGWIRESRQSDPDGNGPLTDLRTRYEYDAVGNVILMIDARGNETTYAYDSKQNLILATQADGTSTRYEYDGLGNQVAMTDELGRTTRYVYDGQNRAVQTLFPNGDTQRTHYDGQGRVLETIDAAGNRRAFRYDVMGRLVETTDAAGNTSTNTYDAFGNLASSTDRRGHTTTYQYDRLHRLRETRGPESIASKGPSFLSTTDYDADGNVVRTASYNVDRLMAAGTIIPDSNPRSLINVNPDFVQVWETTYDAHHRPVDVTNPLGHTTTTTYDDADRVRFEIDERLQSTEFLYDLYGRLTQVREPRPAAGDPQPVTTYTLDAMGNRVAVTDPRANVTRFEYDTRNRLVETTDALGETARTFFDAAGQLVITVDALGRATRTVFDDRGRRLREYGPDPDGVGPLVAPETRYAYDAAGNLIRVTDPLGLQSKFTYDELNRLVTETLPVAAPFELPETTTHSTYDASGNRTSTTDPYGRVSRFAYDALDRLVLETPPVLETIDYERILDNGESGFTLGSGWGAYANSWFYRDNYVTSDGIWDGVSSWTFENVPDGLYQVSATWFANAAYTPQAPFEIFDGEVQRSRTFVNQQASPDDARASGTDWEHLGQPVYVESGTLRVDLASVGSGPTIGDAIRIERLDPANVYSYDALGNQTSASDLLGHQTSYRYDLAGQVLRETMPPTEQVDFQTILDDDNYHHDASFVAGIGATGGNIWGHYSNNNYFGQDYTTSNTPLDGKARWTFGNLDTGWYQVAATWHGYHLFTDEAEFSIYDNNVLRSTVHQDQRYDPNDYQLEMGGKLVPWENLGMPVFVSNGTIFVDLISTEPASGGPATIADAVRIERVDPGYALAYDKAGNQTSLTDPLGRITTSQYDNLNRLDRTTAPAAPTQPGGPPVSGHNTYTYDAVGNLVTQTDPEGRTTSYEYDALNRVSRETPPTTEDQIVTQIIDNGAAGFSMFGDWSSATAAGSYANDFAQLWANGPHTGVATWTFDDLPLGVYQVATSWNGWYRNTDAAPFTIRDGNQERATIHINQQAEPDDYESNSAWWEMLGQPILVTSGSLSIELRFGEGGHYTLADAVRIERVDPAYLYAYDAVGNQVAVRNPIGQVTSYAYDQLNRPVVTTLPDPDGPGQLAAPVTTTAYDQGGRVAQVIEYRGGQNRTTGYTYDPIFGHPTGEILDQGGADETRVHFVYDSIGRLVETEDVLGRKTRHEYDDRDRQTAVIRDHDGPDEVRFESEYDEVGNLIAERNATDIRQITDRYTYDAQNRLVEEVTFVWNSPHETTTYAYDDAGNLVALVDAEGQTTTYAYDALNRQATITLPDPDGPGGLLAPRTNTWYDLLGNLRFEQNREGERTIYHYDALDRLTLVRDPRQAETVSVFDPSGNLLEVTDPEGNTTSYAYDALNRTTRETNELGKSRLYVYDNTGNVVQTTDRNGRVRTYTYDRLDRLETEKWLEGNTVVHTLAWTYDDAGRTISAADGGYLDTFDYDNLDRLKSFIHDSQAADNISFGYAYNDRLGRWNRTDVVGNAIYGIQDHTTDHQGRVDSITFHRQGSSTQGTRVDLDYDRVGNPNSIVRYAGLTTGHPIIATTSYAYDFTHRLKGLSHERGTSTIASYAYDYDKASRIIGFDSADDGDNTIVYDDAGQITSASLEGESYTYDANGNRTFALAGGTPPSGSNYQITPNNRLESDGQFTYAYDDEGNRIRRIGPGSVTAYVWDHRNRLTQVIEYAAPIGESGQIDITQANASSWTTVELNGSYSNPVVIVSPVSANNSQPSTVRVKGVNATSFQVQIDEWDYLDGAHTTETLFYLVVEAGTYALPGGGQLVAGTRTANHSWATTTFDQPFAAKPIVLSQAMSYAGTEAVTTRHNLISTTGFQIRLQEQQAGNQAHAFETVGYVALELGQGSATGGVGTWEVDRTGNSVTHAWYPLDFDQQFAAPPAFFASMQTYRGGDASVVRYRQLSPDDVQVRVEEEASYDAETNHTTEQVGYLVLAETGPLFAAGSEVRRTEYDYDTRDLRVRRRVYNNGSATPLTDEHFVYDDTSQLAYILEADGDVRHRYLSGPQVDQVLADEVYNANGNYSTTRWLLTDHQNTVRDLVDENGATHRHIAYDTFGNITAIETGTGQPTAALDTLFTYTGREHDPTTGLTNYRARWYDPAVARFVSEDPLGLAAGDPNPYRYVGNSAVNYVDPSGMVFASAVSTVFDGINAAAGFVGSTIPSAYAGLAESAASPSSALHPVFYDTLGTDPFDMRPLSSTVPRSLYAGADPFAQPTIEQLNRQAILESTRTIRHDYLADAQWMYQSQQANPRPPDGTERYGAAAHLVSYSKLPWTERRYLEEQAFRKELVGYWQDRSANGTSSEAFGAEMAYGLYRTSETIVTIPYVPLTLQTELMFDPLGAPAKAKEMVFDLTINNARDVYYYWQDPSIQNARVLQDRGADLAFELGGGYFAWGRLRRGEVSARNNAVANAEVRHAAWGGDVNAIGGTMERLGQRALRQSGRDWRRGEQLFEGYLQGVSNRLRRVNSRFGVEIQPAATAGGQRVPGFVHLHRGNSWSSSLITNATGNPRLFAFPGSRRLDAGIIDLSAAANSQGLRPVVAGFDMTLDASKPNIVSYYQQYFGNIPIYDIRLP